MPNIGRDARLMLLGFSAAMAVAFAVLLLVSQDRKLKLADYGYNLTVYAADGKPVAKYKALNVSVLNGGVRFTDYDGRTVYVSGTVVVEEAK